MRSHYEWREARRLITPAAALGPLLATSYIAVKREEAAFFKEKSPQEEALQHFYKY